MVSSEYTEMETIAAGRQKESQDNLSLHLNRGNASAFIRDVKANRSRVNGNNGRQTYLQYACQHNMPEIVAVLIELKADLNLVSEYDPRPPIMIAGYEGYYEIVKRLVDADSIAYDPISNRLHKSVLHVVLAGIEDLPKRSKYFGSSNSTPRNHYKCLEYLLNNVECHKLGINFVDKNNKTVLCQAFQLNDVNVIELLLQRGAYMGEENRNGDTPIKYAEAETLETIFDNCISTNDKCPSEDNYEIIYNYRLLAPLKKSRPSFQISNLVESRYEYEIVAETNVLLQMSEMRNLRPLLLHPLMHSFLNLKWYAIRKYFWLNVAFYVLFWLFLSLYMIFVYGPARQATIEECEEAGTLTTRSFDPNCIIPMRQHERALWFGTFVLCILLMMREIFQIIVSPVRYFLSFENWLELCLVTGTFMVLLTDSQNNNIRCHIAAVAIFLSWMELVLLVGRHPFLSTNVEMFKVVLCNFLKFLAWYSMLILAFAISFYILFKNSSSECEQRPSLFVNPIVATFKAIVMTAGEFDTSSIPFEEHPVTSHLLFLLFVFLVAIVLVNLLNGLAVNDTQAIKADAELVAITSRARLIAYIETIAISNPFSFLNFCECFLRLGGNSKFGQIRVFYDAVSLFPKFFPDRNVSVMPNMMSRVVRPDSSYSYGCKNEYCDWSVQPEVIKASKQILSKRLAEDTQFSSKDEILKYLLELRDYVDAKINAVTSHLKKS